MMRILAELEKIVNNFKPYSLKIDTIRTRFNKTIRTRTHPNTKINSLRQIAKLYGYEWIRLDKNSDKFLTIKKRYTYDKELNFTNAYYLHKNKKALSVYYANSKNSDRKIATLEIYGLAQYNKAPLKKELLEAFLSVANNITSLDICFDLEKPFNTLNLSKFLPSHNFNGTIYYDTKELKGIIRRLYVYDKTLKDDLNRQIYRVEAEILISLDEKSPYTKKELLNLKLTQALDELKKLIDKLV